VDNYSLIDTAEDSLAVLKRELAGCMIVDRPRFEGQLSRLGRLSRTDREFEALLGRVRAGVAQSQAKAAERRHRMPQPRYPAELPVVSRRTQIAATIEQNQVTIVCGETGSGKTTQLPKICLDLGRGVTGLIGHTQPRRIAARSVAARIAQELGTELGDVVGYKVRFQDRLQPSAYVKLMTDGILLAETQGDRQLAAYETLIIDEAHERSLNIDFLLGYLHRLLPARPDLKVVITSATIDAERFSKHFGGAPVIEVSGRLYPVEVRYRPVEAADEDDPEPALMQGILNAVDEACRAGPGHILIFLPGEREIRETAEALRKHKLAATEVLPLYARLSATEQERVFAPSTGRRIVLATNVAETSLTVPGIRYVIDPGLARINRYSYRNKVEQLLTEKISQSSANQRAGRCGRVMSGVCFRLYSEADYAARALFADPELLRSSLAGVILRMHAFELGAIEGFPFLDPPQPRMITDGYQLLVELGAVDVERRITQVGRELARLPIEPRIGRMILEARRRGCLTEVLVIAAALCVQDPRDRPFDKAQAADDRHAPFRDERSDFVGLLKLWAFHSELLAEGRSGRKLGQVLREHFLSPLRLREWRDVHGQLHTQVTESGGLPNEVPAPYEQVHRALLAGLLGNVGMRHEEGDYAGARGIRFAVHPASAVRKRAPKWLVAAELVETTRLYARAVAQIEAEWIEHAAAHLVRRAWLEPRWDKDRAEVVAWEQVTLYGLVLVARRRVSYGAIDPARSHEIFLRSGLAEGGYVSRAPFQQHNVALRRELEALEHKARRRDVLVDEEAICRFFAERVPAEVCDGAGFEAWRKTAERSAPRLLYMTRADLTRQGGDSVTADLFPETMEIDGATLKLRYRFDPGHPLDGVTADVPLHLLNRLRPERFEWLVPGLLRDKINALVRGLPKTLRRACVPLPETVTACLQALEASESGHPLLPELAAVLRRVRGISVSLDDLRAVELPPHLMMHFSLRDAQGKEIAEGRDLSDLQRAHDGVAQEQFVPVSRWESSGLRAWPDDFVLDKPVEFRRGGDKLVGYPALLDDIESVRSTLLETADKARTASRGGISRLVRFAMGEQMRMLARTLTPDRPLALRYAAYGNAQSLAESMLRASVDRAVWADETPIRDRREFDARLKQVRARLQLVGQEVLRLTGEILSLAHAVREALAAPRVRAYKHAVTDIEHQLGALVFSDFIAVVPYARLQHYSRYLSAILRRLEKLPERHERDAQHTRDLQRWWQAIETRRELDRKSGCCDPALEEFRWMLEEQRVSLFAQELRTPYPVSFKRLERAWAALD